MKILFKYYADVENYESFRGFGFIYMLVLRFNQNSYVNYKIDNKNK